MAKNLNISGYTFSTTSVPTTPALRVESGTGTYYVNLTTGQRPGALSYQKVFTVSTTNYSFLRPFVTSNSLTGYSGVSNNSTVTTGYSGVSNNSTKTTGYAGVSNNSTVTTGYSGVSNNSTVTTGYSGVSSKSSTYGYSGYLSSTAADTTNTVVTYTTLLASIYTWFGGYYVYEATFSPIVPYRVTWHYWQGATSATTFSTSSLATFNTSKCNVKVIGYGGQVGLPHALFSNTKSEVFSLYLTKNYTGTSALTTYGQVWTTKNVTVSTTTDKYGILLSQVPLTKSSSYNSSSTAKGNLSSITDLTRTATRYSSSTAKAYLSSITDLTRSTTRYSSSTAKGNLSSITDLTVTTTRYSSSTAKAYLSSITSLTKSATRYSSSTTVGNLSSTTELRTVTRL